MTETETASSAATLLATLQHIWENYTQAASSENGSTIGDDDLLMQTKHHWLRLFLCHFQCVTDAQLSGSAADDDECSAFQRFFSPVPEEVCSYLLERVYDIISASVAHSNGIDAIPPLASSAKSSKQLHRKHNFAQLILQAPSDCYKIVALRTFLTHELGQHLLHFLLRVNFKLIASQQSLCNLCINLYPNCSWGDVGIQPPALLQPCSDADIADCVGNLCLYYRPAHSLQPAQLTEDPVTAAAKAGGRQVSDPFVLECELSAFDASRRNGDEIAELLVRLLNKCVMAECDSALTEQSMSVTALNFAFDALRMPGDACVGGVHNENVIKLRLLQLTELCLNKLYAHAADNIVATVQFPYVFAQLAAALRSNQATTASSCIAHALVYNIFGVLYNLVAIYASNHPNVRPGGLYDALQLNVDAGAVSPEGEDLLALCIRVLQQQPRELPVQRIYGASFKLLLRIIDDLNVYETQHTGHATDAYSRRRQRRKSGAVAQRQQRQEHCEAPPTLSCRFQGVLFALLPHLSDTLQAQSVAYLARAGACCCHYTLATYANCLAVAVRIAPAHQRCAYKFLQCRLLQALCVREGAALPAPTGGTRRRQKPRAASACCARCDGKYKSPEFHTRLLELYRDVYAQHLSAPTAAVNEAKILRIFLQHLRSIAPLLVHELAAGVLAEIVLPVFRQQKAALALAGAGSDVAHQPHILHECLSCFAAYLCDIRLIKAFYNEENIAHLEELLAAPLLIRGVCELLRIGIDNIGFLGESGAEQVVLSRRLITLQLESSRRAAQLFNALLRRLQCCGCSRHACKFWLDEMNDTETEASPSVTEDLCALDVLNVAALQWSLNYELLRTSPYFCHEFAKIYAIEAAPRPGHTQQTIGDILQLNFNALSSFLLLSPPTTAIAIASQLSVVPQRQQQKQEPQEQYFHKSTETSAVTADSDDKAIDCWLASRLEETCAFDSDTWHSSASSYVMVVDTITNNTITATMMNDRDEPESYESVISRYTEDSAASETDEQHPQPASFLHQLQQEAAQTSSAAMIYDIRRQQLTTSASALTARNAMSVSGDAFAAAADAQQPAVADSQLPASGSGLIGRLFHMFGTLLYGTVGGAGGIAAPQRQPHKQEQCELSAELRDCFYQANGDGKRLLLKLFEATIAICVKGYRNEQGEAMEQHLSRLKAAILSNAQLDWRPYFSLAGTEHQQQQQLATARDNPVLQALQTLLRVAELAETAAASVTAATVEQPETQPGEQTDDEPPLLQGQVPTIQRARAGSCMLPPALPLPVAAASRDKKRRSNADSETEDAWSENDADAVSNDDCAESRHVNDENHDDGYEADAELPSAAGDSETETYANVTADLHATAAVATTAPTDLWSGYAPASRYRTHVVHAGLSRLVVQLLMELAQLCAEEPHGWCDSLTQLANRLYVIRDCLGGPLFLLRGFAPLLICNDARLRELQQSILELVTEFNTPDVLGVFLGLLAAPNPPADVLVQHLNHSRLATLKKAQASVELEFPMLIDANCKCVSTAPAHITADIERLRSQHLQQQTVTPLTRAPCLIPLMQPRLWSDDGLTVALWLHVNGTASGSGAAARRQKSASLLLSDGDDTLRSCNEDTQTHAHIVSLGTPEAMLSVYFNSALNLIFELTRPNAERSTAPQPVSAAVTPTQTDGVIEQLELSNGGAAAVPATSFRTALKHTKRVLLHGFSQMQLFNGNSGGALASHEPDATPAHVQYATWTLTATRLRWARWTHLSFGMKARADCLDVTVYIDGLEEHALHLPFYQLRQALRLHQQVHILALGDSGVSSGGVSSHNNNNSSTTSCCSSAGAETSPVNNNGATNSHSTLDGSAALAAALRFSVTSVMLFRRHFEQRRIIAHLTAMGPNFSELTRCQVGNWPPNYGHLPLAQLQTLAELGDHGEALQRLREARLLVYTAQRPHSAMSYGNALAGGESCGLIRYGELLERHTPSLQTATVLSGGLATQLYYFARVVEVSTYATTQAMALDLLLSVAHGDAQLYAEFQRNDYLNLIGYVIRTERCTKDVQLLRSIVNNACTQPLICQRGGGGGPSSVDACVHLYVHETTTACVVYPRLLISVLQRYADWQRSGAQHSDVLDMLLTALLALTRDKHPHREFNMDQLSRGGCVRQLLNLCKVQLSEAHSPIYISESAARSYVSLLATFAGSPPAPSLMDEVMKLLLLLQRASESYITHNRANFYFLLSAAVPQSPVKEKSRSGASLSLSRTFQRGLTSRPGSASRQPMTGADDSPLDADRLERIERLRRLHAQRQPPANARRRMLNEFEETLERVADCRGLNKPALRLLSPVEVGRWRLKFLRHATPQTTPHACRSCSPKKLGRRRWAIGRAARTMADDATDGGVATASMPRNTRKRLRLASASSATRAIYAVAEKRQRLRAERRCSDTSLLALAASLAHLGQRDGHAADEDVFDAPVGAQQPRRPAPPRSKKPATADFHNSPGVMALQEGLFTLLKDFVYLLPDSAVDEVLHHYVKVEFLMVLANHPNCAVRAAIVRLLAALSKRLSVAELDAHARRNYAQHLANQLAIHDTDAAMFLACVEWVTGLYGSTLDAVLAHVEALRVQQRFGVPALLAVAAKSVLSPASILDTSPNASTFHVLHNIFLTQTAEEQWALIGAGLIECCLKALHNLYSQPTACILAGNEAAILDLLTTIGSKSLKSARQINIIWDIMNMFTFCQDQPQSPLSLRSAFRSAHARLQFRLLELFLVAPPNSPSTPMTPTTPTTLDRKSSAAADNSLTASEARTRLELLIDRCAQFFTAHDVDAHTLSASETQLFELLVTYGIATQQRCNSFIAWGLLPSRSRELRAFIVDSLWRACRDDKPPAVVADGKMISSLLLLCLYEDIELGIPNLKPLCARLGIHEENGQLMRSLETELERIKLSQRQLSERQRQAAERTVYKLEPLAIACYQSSMVLTREVTVLQNQERKLVMGHMKSSDEETHSYAKWLEIIRRMTHEGAAWHAPQRAENSWELDDTEGPSRVHTRLRRCRLDIHRRFFMEDYAAAPSPPPSPSASKTTAHSEHRRRPLEYLLSSNYDQQRNIAHNTQVLYNFAAKYMPVDGEIDGEIIVTEHRLCFVATYRCRYFYVSADIASIAEIWLKRYQHQEKAFEVFLDTNRSMFFTLQHERDWNQLRHVFADKIVQPRDTSRLQAITQQWRDGMLTNWEYLMTLNQIAGRTYNDLMQYPVFPWILANYTTQTLDLTEAANYRQLQKPIAVQHEANEQHYISNYQYIANTMTNIGTLTLPPYHYSSHYSNSGTVLHFLVRVPPFTSYFLRYQDNNFDLPDRTFHALSTTWNLASRDSPTDVKELIPEFFCLPEMFENFERFNFGFRQSGERVEDVQLPPWCHNDARLFVLIHRQALESEAVRYQLHHWIDLIFGFKQVGESAVDAINVFHPATYSTMGSESTELLDSIERKAIETMVRTYGQMPRQLFKTPHAASKQLKYSLVQRPVLPSVRGLRWGVYLGSPQLSAPVLGDIHKLAGAERLIAFRSTNVVYALQARECVMQGAEVDTFNVVSWGHADHIVRIESLSRRAAHASTAASQARRALLPDDSCDPITACAADPHSNQLWFGHKSGRISVYRCTAAAGDGTGAVTKTSRPSYVRDLYQSYNSAFRKLTAKEDTSYSEDGISPPTVASPSLNSSDSDCSREGSCADLAWSGPNILVRHTDEINCLALSVEFKIAVSAGRDGLAVIWDLNDWRYVRTIERPAEILHSPITQLAISPTLGDIVTVHTLPQSENLAPSPPPTSNVAATAAADECFEVTEESLDDFVNVSVHPQGKAILRLHTVNARYVAHVLHDERIDAVCYTYIKEGVGVNCIATAVEGGIVRLWSSWNLGYVAEFFTGKADIRSITYSTHQHLVVLMREAHIQVWQVEGLYGSAPKFPQIDYK